MYTIIDTTTQSQIIMYQTSERWPAKWDTAQPRPGQSRVIPIVDPNVVPPLGSGTAFGKPQLRSHPPPLGTKPGVNTTADPEILCQSRKLGQYSTQKPSEVLSQIDQNSMLPLEGLREEITNHFEGGINRMRRIFLDCPSDPNGLVDSNVLSRAISSLGLRCGDNAITELIQKCDYQNNAPTFDSSNKTVQTIARQLHQNHKNVSYPNPNVVNALSAERFDTQPTEANDFGRENNFGRAAVARSNTLRYRVQYSNPDNIEFGGDLLYHDYAEAWEKDAQRYEKNRQLVHETPAAGIKSINCVSSKNIHGKQNEHDKKYQSGVAATLSWDTRPPTPPHIAKFRKSVKRPVGRSSLYSSFDSVPNFLPKPKKDQHSAKSILGLCGSNSEKCPGNLPKTSMSKVQLATLEAQERTYLKCLDSKRLHEVGKRIHQRYPLPSNTSKPDFAFGCKSSVDSKSSTAKTTLFPDGGPKWAHKEPEYRHDYYKDTKNSSTIMQMRRNGRNFPVGIQRRRNYEFPKGIDGYKTFRFGETTDAKRKNNLSNTNEKNQNIPNGVKGCLQMYEIGPIDEHTFLVSDAQTKAWRRKNHIGKVRKLGTSDFGQNGFSEKPHQAPVSGKKYPGGTTRNRCVAGEVSHTTSTDSTIPECIIDSLHAIDVADVGTVIRGSYTESEQKPDFDLGKATRRGHRNIPLPGDEERRFGVSSVGDLQVRPSHLGPGDVICDSAARVLHPSCYEKYGIYIEENELYKELPRQEIREIFLGIGHKFSNDEFCRICNHAENNGTLSIVAFQKTMNEYLDAVRNQTDEFRNPNAPRMLPSWWYQK